MRTKIYLPIILLVAAVLLAACGGTSQTGQPQVRMVNVTGNAQVILTPDIAYISIGVHTEAHSAQEAVTGNSTHSQAVIDAIKAQGVDAKDIQTTNFSVYQQEKFGPNGDSLGIFFMVDNTVYVTMRDIQKIGSILDASVAAGANSIYGITFDVLDKETALTTGRDQAMADAKSQAEQLAQAAGATLGPVQSISYYSSAPTPIYYDNKGIGGGGAPASPSVPVAPGQLTLTVSVSVAWELK